MSGIRGTVLAVRFLCELGVLAALAYWGLTVGDGAFAWVLAIGAPLIAGAIWGTFVAPKAKRPVPLPVRLAIEIDVFAAAAIALWFAGAETLAVVLGVAGVITSVLNAVTERAAVAD